MSKSTRFQPGNTGRPKGAKNKTTAEMRDAARALVDDPAYRSELKARLLAGKLAPAMEALLWHYAWGKPKETVDLVAPEAQTFTLKIGE